MLGPELTFAGRTEVEVEGRRLAFFGGNDYHRFSTHPEVIRALCEAAQSQGVSSAGSRGTTANRSIYQLLETEIARFLGTEAAVLCASGYLANTVAVQALAAQHDHVLTEARAHSSLVEAATGSGLPLASFASRDPEALEASLQRSGRALILCDGVAPSTGHIAPLRDYADLAAQHSATLIVDDAHGIGTLGVMGRGTPEEAGLPPGRVVQTGTLSKAFGCYGGLVAGSREVVNAIQDRSTAFVGATPIPLPIAAAALRAIRLLRDEPERLTLLRVRTRRLKDAASSIGHPVSPGAAPIVSLTFPTQEGVERFRETLLAHDVYPCFIRYPGAPAGGHFRFTLSSEHSPAQVSALVAAVGSAPR